MKINEEDFCEICFSCDAEDSPIIYCDKCDSCFHLQCAHLDESIINEDNFVCSHCKNG